jgi:outer membrane biosynthesis protein TonB
MKTASAISTGLHAAVLLWALVSFSGKTFEVTQAESLPVDLVTEKQFSELTKGIKEAPKPVEKPKPLVEKKDTKQITAEEIVAKLTEKKEVKPMEEKAAEPKTDPIADKIKKEEKKEEKKDEAKAEPKPLPPKKPEHKQPKFDADKIAALLDKRAPQRNAATGDTLNDKPSLGHVTGAASRLSQSEIDAFRRRITDCWTVPAGAAGADDLAVVFRVLFNKDGTIARGPDIVKASASVYGPAFADSGRRAILQCQPYTMLKPDSYDLWKDMEIQFSPRDMFRG